MDEQDVFDDETEVTEADEVEETEETEKGVTEDKTEEEEEESPASDTEAKVPMSAFLGERQRRQRAEEQLKQKAELPDPVTDQEGFQSYLEQVRTQDKINMSTAWAKKTYEDYPEVEQKFLKMVVETDSSGNLVRSEEGNLIVKDQNLYEQFASADLPADFAYDYVKQVEAYTKKTSPDYESSLKEQARQELLAELKSKGALVVDPSELPDLATVADVQSNNSLTEKGDSDRIDAFDE